ncbi:MAG: hypothetical protein WAO69_11430 [Aestuariivita sp.]|uniref:hypothetical protein n=1 Tax=Aestuariivita sp. TaxID=1872407 RepID=UPI003BB1FF3D
MLVSGDISSSSLADNNPKSSSLYRHCVRLTNYFNPYDAALSLSNIKRIGVSPRAGRVGLPDTLPGKAVEVDTGTYYAANAHKFDHIPNDSHTWYFFDEVFMRDVYETVKGDVDRNRISTRVGTHNRLSLST